MELPKFFSLSILTFALVHHVYSDYNSKPYNRRCGHLSGLSEAQYQSALDNLWTRDEKCYITCELEEGEYINRGKISIKFKQQAEALKNSTKTTEKLFGNIQSLCIERAERVTEPCEVGFTYYFCYMTLGRISGAFSMFLPK